MVIGPLLDKFLQNTQTSVRNSYVRHILYHVIPQNEEPRGDPGSFPSTVRVIQ